MDVWVGWLIVLVAWLINWLIVDLLAVFITCYMQLAQVIEGLWFLH